MATLLKLYNLYKDLNPATLSGAIDVIVVRSRKDEEWRCSPFHVRFGKLKLLLPQEKTVSITINGEPVDLFMKLGDQGEAFFVVDVADGHASDVDSDYWTSPIIAPAENPAVAESMQPLDLEDYVSAVGSDTSSLDHAEQMMSPAPVTAHAEMPPTPTVLKKIQLQDSPATQTPKSSDDNRRPSNPSEKKQLFATPAMDDPADLHPTPATPYRRTRSNSVVFYHELHQEQDPTTLSKPTPMRRHSVKAEAVADTLSDTEFELQKLEEPSWTWGHLPKRSLSSVKPAEPLTVQDIDENASDNITEQKPKPQENIPQEEIITNQEDTIVPEATLLNSLLEDTLQAVSEDLTLDAKSTQVLQEMEKESEELDKAFTTLPSLPSSPLKAFPPISRASSPIKEPANEEDEEVTLELSLCGPFKNDKMSKEDMYDLFAKKKISYDDFWNDLTVLQNKDLVVKIGHRYLLYNDAMPILVSQAVYGNYELSKLSMNKKMGLTNRYSAYLKSWFSTSKGANQAEPIPEKIEKESPVKAELQPPVEKPRPREKAYLKSLRLSSDQLKSLKLKSGMNTVTFSVNSEIQGTASCSARIFLWDSDEKIVISDIDGTITKSDALGHLFTMVGRDWTHLGVAFLYTSIVNNGYKIMYLTSRAIGQAESTRDYLKKVEQGPYQLPDGPVIMSPDRLLSAIHREMILRKPQEFKMACLKDIKSLFVGNDQPFYAGFGNRITDALSYRSVDIPASRIFTIDPTGVVKQELMAAFKSSYLKLTDLVDHIFPPPRDLVSEFTDFSYWKAALPPLDDDILKQIGGTAPSSPNKSILDEFSDDEDGDDDLSDYV